MVKVILLKSNIGHHSFIVLVNFFSYEYVLNGNGKKILCKANTLIFCGNCISKAKAGPGLHDPTLTQV